MSGVPQGSVLGPLLQLLGVLKITIFRITYEYLGMTKVNAR